MRDGLDRALAMIGAGDVLVVWKLDRLGRSMAELVGIIEYLKGAGHGFKSLTAMASIDTTRQGPIDLWHLGRFRRI